MRGGSGCSQRPSSAHRRRRHQQSRSTGTDPRLPRHQPSRTVEGTDGTIHLRTYRHSSPPSPPAPVLASPARHVLCCHRDGGGGGAQLPADASEAGRAGVRLPGALPGRGSRDEPGVGDGRRPVLPLPVGVLLEAGEHRELAVQQHVGLR